MSTQQSLSAKLHSLYDVARFRPALTVGIIGLSSFAALLEGIGLSFLLPVIQLARDPNAAESADGIMGVFVRVYETLGVPFSLETVILGVALVITVRFTTSFAVAWLRTILREQYMRHLQRAAFLRALDAEIQYFDTQGSDEILNAIVTQASYAGDVILNIVRIVEQGLLSLMYLCVALIISPWLTILAGLILGTITFLLRYVLESAYDIGDEVASANERIQTVVQSGMQGIRDVKLFGLAGELRSSFDEAVDQSIESRILLVRNRNALDNAYQLLTALTVFGLIYAALRYASLSIADLGVFLLAMFRLAPRISTLNNRIYKVEGNLPHLTRTQEFIDELAARTEPDAGTQSVPDEIDRVTFDEVSFSYGPNERIFDDLSLSFETGEFVAFVGPSGAGKSTIVSLLTRMYEPDEGEIRADGTAIDEFPIREWRSRISVVRQHPYIFNDTLERNVTVADRDASREEVERVAELAQVTEFVDDLPNGYETVLGDDGVRLSGGQKQRVALARALLKDAEFLVLDEATSDLDTNIEQTVHDAIESMDRDYAMLVIAHRLSTVVNADRIYTLRDGRIEEAGAHEELVEQGGTYADLYATQTTER